MKTIGIFLSATFLSMAMFAAPNPAYEYCIANGGQIETRADELGNQYGICMFDEDGVYSECNQWWFIRGDCNKGECGHWSVNEGQCTEPL